MRTMTGRQDIMMNVNGEVRQVTLRPADTLLYTLREQLGLTGAKPGCENGDCGACTVVVNGAPVKSCMVLTAEVEEKTIRTVEGLHNAIVQDAFLDHWAFQCGYCTSGFLMLVEALIHSSPDADEAKMLEWLRSNICRCTGYEEITEACRTSLARARATRPPGHTPALRP